MVLQVIQGAVYNIQSVILDPREVSGFCVARPRRYTILTLKKRIKFYAKQCEQRRFWCVGWLETQFAAEVLRAVCLSASSKDDSWVWHLLPESQGTTVDAGRNDAWWHSSCRMERPCDGLWFAISSICWDLPHQDCVHTYVLAYYVRIFDGVMSDPCVNIYLMTALPRFVRLPRVVSKCSCRRSESGSIPPGTKRFSELADPHHFLQQLVPHESQTSAEPEP